MKSAAACCALLLSFTALAQAPQEPTTTLKVSVKRVSIDVVVTDSRGNPVKGLTASDFHIMEDNTDQSLRSFTTYTLEPQPRIEIPKLPPNTFSNFAAAPDSGPATVLLYDLLNTPLDSQPFAYQQLLSYLRSRKSTPPVAIFALTGGLHMLQGFTEDDNLLISALNQKSKRAYKSSLLQTGDEASRQSDELARTEGNVNGASDVLDPSYQAVSSMLKHMETMESSAFLDRRVEITAEALVEISSFLSGMPGRKNLVWLSGSFPAGVLPDPDLGTRDAFQITRTYSASIRKATAALTQSHTAVYPVDVRGLQVNPMFAAGSTIDFPPGSGRDLRAVRTFGTVQASEHATMDTVADETGGHAFYNGNGLKEAIAAAVVDGSTYYAMTYASTNTKQDGALRHIKVVCLKPGYHLAYRQTYFADNAKAPPPAVVADANDPMGLALRHGAPSGHELFFEIHVQPEGTAQPATPQQIELLAKYNVRSRKKAAQNPAPMMQHYLVSYAVLGRQLLLAAGPDGVRHGNLEFAVMAFDDDGNPLDGIRTKVQDAIPPDRFQKIHNGAYEILQRIVIPASSASLRIGVRDAETDHIGSMELRLPLAPVPAGS